MTVREARLACRPPDNSAVQPDDAAGSGKVNQSKSNFGGDPQLTTDH